VGIGSRQKKPNLFIFAVFYHSFLKTKLSLNKLKIWLITMISTKSHRMTIYNHSEVKGLNKIEIPRLIDERENEITKEIEKSTSGNF
jgi:hypothetical protein